MNPSCVFTVVLRRAQLRFVRCTDLHENKFVQGTRSSKTITTKSSEAAKNHFQEGISLICNVHLVIHWKHHKRLHNFIQYTIIFTFRVVIIYLYFTQSIHQNIYFVLCYIITLYSFNYNWENIRPGVWLLVVIWNIVDGCKGW